MTAKELLQLMERANIRLSTKSDDGFKFYILHYLCYFGEVEEVRRLSAYGEFQELAYNTTETNDIALTIALLTPEVDEERKVQLATLLYGTSNLAISNNNNQNPVQLVILMGRVGLLFRMTDCLKVFPSIHILTAGGPGIATQTINYYAYRQAFNYGNYGYASALGIILLIFAMVLALGLLGIFQIKRRERL